MKYQIEIAKILEILSTKIYDSSFALLRENVQNAYDAVLLRMYRNPKTFTPRIDVKITPVSVEVRDNGIGMTVDDLRDHFWRAGASGKNNVEAISAGVVGTFGIGGLANFGVCQKLTVITESASNNKRTKCRADKDTLSLEEDCISIENLEPLNEPGTVIIAELPSSRAIDVKEATRYLKTFVEHVPIPIYINEEQVSMKPLEDSCPVPEGIAWSSEIKNNKADSLECDLKFKISESGIIWIEMENIKLSGNPIDGRILFKQGIGQIMAFRSGFGLSRTGVYSIYSFGGVADLKVLQPTAGRDALTNASVQVLQTITSSAEQMIAPIVADSPYTDMNTYFMSWAAQRKRFDLLGNLKVALLPTGKRMSLRDVSDLSEKIYVNYYNGTQESVAKDLATEETPLIYIARSNPRARCETEYLARFSKAHLVSGEPQVFAFRPDTSWNREEAALAFKIGQVLGSDYFMPVQIKFGKITHNLPLLIKDDVTPPILTLDPSNSTIQTLLQCYTSDFFVFNSFAKDFVRNIVFPRIAHLVPSSTREGAEAFLKILRRQRDVFEYDSSEMRQLDDVIADFAKGSTSLSEAIDAALIAVRKQQQVVSVSDVKKATSVMPDIVSNQLVLEAEEVRNRGINYSAFAPKPAILRNDVETDAKILVLEDSEIMFDYKGLLRLSEKAYIDRAEFFYQPHYTEIIWGGQRIIFIFRHVSGTFGFYYDIQLNELMAIPSGGASFETMTVILKNSVFLPIPSTLFQFFAPKENEKKKFDVRYDILYPES
ncbi:MAG TPA: ATP-binding protein [Candidatus Bathyarchaeia archaeon]|nr:ATP-binding protein [Candidatus Bathyarchaeia archaeon]